MSEKALDFRTFVNEGSDKNPIDMDKLAKYAMGISLCCAGEYGDVYYKEEENHVFVCLGDSNPFDEESLIDYIKDAVSKDYDGYQRVKVTIENEAHPTGEGWQLFDPKKNKFVDCK